jgi:hypothetical protein
LYGSAKDFGSFRKDYKTSLLSSSDKKSSFSSFISNL